MKSIRTKLIVKYSLLITVLLVVMIISGYVQTKNSLDRLGYDVLLSKLESDINSMDVYIEKYYGKLSLSDVGLVDLDGNTILEDNSMVDNMGEDLNDAVTIFAKDGDDYIRVATNIPGKKNGRATGTYLGKDSSAYDSINGGKRFIGKANILGESYITAYDPVFDDEKKVIGINFVGIKVDDMNVQIDKDLNSFIIVFVGISVAAVIFGVVVSVVISNNIVKPIVNTKKFAEALAAGDLTVEIDKKYMNDKTEIGELIKAFLEMKLSLIDLIVIINNLSKGTNETANILLEASKNAANSAEDVSRTVFEIAKGATDQAVNTEKGMVDVISLGDVINENHQMTLELASKSKEIMALSNEGLENIKSLNKVTDLVRGSQEDLREGINKTSLSAEKISAATDIISSISDQTNLLALNAAIEAARAGDAGRGFAVVADEIRKLAEESQRSTVIISEVIEELKVNSDKSVMITDESHEALDQQLESVKVTEHKFEQIFKSIEGFINALDKINISGNEMESMKEKVLDAIQNLSAIAEENASSTQEVTATVDEITAEVENVSEITEELVKSADMLGKSTSQFKV